MVENNTGATGGAKTPNCKICCACPAERRARDECTILRGLDACQAEVDAFYKCLLREGFSEDDVNSLRKSARNV
ncbi:Cytochrome c oxidase copper chaperone [Trypanosoma melophagium]|uniref:Cytochrome c oxidase copper chaperone n=1 Tax=Trypanosoma melophagium TaxID=715481 RepID=UPI003519DCF4|nr:Cytochrome c oxidase copper chaperone [Trypanosoma melophagium]